MILLSQNLQLNAHSDQESWGVVLNSFAALENHHLPFLESFYKNDAKAWCLGPALLYSPNTCNINQSSEKCLHWLDNCLSKSVSVMYVSFGTQANLSDKNLDEVDLGLEMSSHHFLWVIKSRTWCPLENRVKGRGLIFRDWVEQRQILAHHAVAGFLSHCGWNSVLESLSLGVLILALPMNAEQPLNAKQVVDELEAGLRVRMGGSSAWGELIIESQAVSDGVRELMGGEKGRKVRDKAKEMGRAARQAIEESGSSYKTMTKLIDKLC